jgi:uncharacterized protein (UPF0333 family)
MKKNFRNGQAALEFMMTYGWAILVVLAAIGALSYFGILNPSRFTPDTCLASSPFSCPGKPIVSMSNAYIAFSLVNGQGYAVTISSAAANMVLSAPMTAAGCTVAGTTVCPQGTTSCAGTTSQLLQPGQGATIVVPCTSATLNSTNVVKGDVTFTYTNPDSKLSESVIVSVTGKPK